VGIGGQGGARGGRSVDLAVVVGAERSDHVGVEGDLAAGALRAGGGPVDRPRRARAPVRVGGAVGPDHDHAGETGRCSRPPEVDMVPAERTEGTAPGSRHDGELQEQRQAEIELLSLGKEMDDVDVGRRLDLLLENLARLGVVCGIAADPAPLHSLTERRAHHGMDPMNAGAADNAALCRHGWSSHGAQSEQAPLCEHTGRSHFLASPARTVLRAGRWRARPVRTRAAPSSQLGVENVEGVGRDLRNVDVVQRPQIAGDDSAVLLERVGSPATLLHGDPLLGQVAEGPARMRSVLPAEFDLPGVRLVSCIPLPCRLDGLGRPPPRAGQGVTPYVDPARLVAQGERRRPRLTCQGL
jgi:hypothetical protein